MLPQLPCPNGSHQPNRSATADRNAVASDKRSAVLTTLIRSGACMAPPAVPYRGMALVFKLLVELSERLASLSRRLSWRGVVGGEREVAGIDQEDCE